MIFTNYLPKQVKQYYCKCHLEPVYETFKETYKCSKTKVALTRDTIFHFVEPFKLQL